MMHGPISIRFTVLSDLNVSDMNHDYKFRLRLAVVKAIPDIYNSLYNEYNVFESPVWPKFFLIKICLCFGQNYSLMC